MGDAANFANPDVSQSLPVRMEKLGLHDSESKGGQLMRENLETVNDDATAIVGTKMNTKLRQNRDNNQKPMDAAAILSRSPTKELPSNDNVYSQLHCYENVYIIKYNVMFIGCMYLEPSQCALCEKAADIQLHPCGHIALCHPCRDSVKAIKRCPQVECRVSENDVKGAVARKRPFFEKCQQISIRESDWLSKRHRYVRCT